MQMTCREQVQQLLFDDKIEDALELCDTQQGPVPAGYLPD